MKKKILLMFMVLMSAMTLWAQTLTINQPDPCTITASNPTPAPGETVTLTVNFNGCAFVLWTVNDLKLFENLAEWGVDGVITNYPKYLAEWAHK